MTNNAILAVNDAHGQYMYQTFAERFEANITNKEELLEDLRIIKERNESEGEIYYDSWLNIENKAKIVIDGNEYTIYEDGDIWLIPISEVNQLPDYDNL